ncbi:hypothetical protein ACXR2U_23835 [Jatrophihabitans sp. YIM 134969]
MGDFDVEIESIRSTVTWMQHNVIDTATKLRSTMSSLNAYAATSDWSTVPSCVDFGASYNAAIEVYTSVSDDILADAQKMAAALSQIADDYQHADESSRARFDAAIKNFAAAGYMTQTPADDTYQDHRGDLHSDHAEQAPTQDPDAATGGDAPTGPPAPANTGGGRVRIE